MRNFKFNNKLLFAKTFSTQTSLEILDTKTLLANELPCSKVYLNTLLSIIYFFLFYILFIQHLFSKVVECIHWFVWFFREIPEKRVVDTTKPWTTEELVAVYLIWVPVLPFTAVSLFIYIIYLIGCLFFGGEPNVVPLQELTSTPLADSTIDVGNSVPLTDGTNEVINPTPDPVESVEKFTFDSRKFEHEVRMYRLNIERLHRSMEVQRQIRARDNLLNGVHHPFRGW